MAVLVKLVGLIIMVLGGAFLLRPKAIKLYIGFWVKGQRVYAGGILSLLIGTAFLFAASRCLLSWLVTTLGILSFIKGMALLALGPEKLRPLFEWWRTRSDTFLRLYSILPLIIGILLIYSA